MRRLCAFVLLLACLPAQAGPVGFTALGDSLTDTYAGKPYAGTHSSWTDLIKAHRASFVDLHEFANAGATSTDMHSQGQPASAVQLVQNGTSTHVTLAIGANDIYGFLTQINPAVPATLDPTATATTLVGNVAAAVAELKAGGAKVVLGNVPNIADTPAIQAATGGNALLLGALGALTDAVNAQLKALASAHKIPLIDLQKLNHLSQGTFMLAGMDVHDKLYSIDGFHPSSLASGLLANVQLEALRQGYGLNVPQFTDAELLAFGGLQGGTPTTTFNAAAFVVQPVPEPSTLLLVGMGAGLLAWRRRKRG